MRTLKAHSATFSLVSLLLPIIWQVNPHFHPVGNFYPPILKKQTGGLGKASLRLLSHVIYQLNFVLGRGKAISSPPIYPNNEQSEKDMVLLFWWTEIQHLQSRCSTSWAPPLIHFGLVIWRWRVPWAVLNLWSSWSQPPKQLGLQAWAISAQLWTWILKPATRKLNSHLTVTYQAGH
jgi:hypothetical protein